MLNTQALRKTEKELHAIQVARGELPDDVRAAYEKQIKAYERVQASLQRSGLAAMATSLGVGGVCAHKVGSPLSSSFVVQSVGRAGCRHAGAAGRAHDNAVGWR